MVIQCVCHHILRGVYVTAVCLVVQRPLLLHSESGVIRCGFVAFISNAQVNFNASTISTAICVIGVLVSVF